MKHIFLLSLIFLVSCSADNDNTCNNETGTAGVIFESNGLTIQASEKMFVTPAQVSQFYDETMACMGLFATGPTVAYRSFSDNFLGATWAFYLQVGETIWLNTDSNETWLPRDCKTDEQALKHEFVHHILNVNGMQEVSNRHTSSLFSCGIGVNVNN